MKKFSQLTMLEKIKALGVPYTLRPLQDYFIFGLFILEFVDVREQLDALFRISH